MIVFSVCLPKISYIIPKNQNRTQNRTEHENLDLLQNRTEQNMDQNFFTERRTEQNTKNYLFFHPCGIHLRYKTGRKTFFVCKYEKVSLLNYFSDVDRFCEIYSRQDIPDSGTRYRTSKKIGVRWKHHQLYNWISSARTEMIILGVLGNEDFIHRNNKWIKLIK